MVMQCLCNTDVNTVDKSCIYGCYKRSLFGLTFACMLQYSFVNDSLT